MFCIWNQYFIKDIYVLIAMRAVCNVKDRFFKTKGYQAWEDWWISPLWILEKIDIRNTFTSAG